MAYAIGNPQTKKALREMVAAHDVTVYQPGPYGEHVPDGETTVEGPHYPQPHRWYARVKVEDGRIVKVIS